MGSSSPGGGSAAFRSLIVTELEQTYPVKAVLEVLGLAASTYYYHRSKASRGDRDLELRPLVRDVFDHSYRSYGYRRIHAVLKAKHGVQISGKTVLKLMRQEGRSCRVRRKKYRAYKGEVGLAAPNVLERDFEASRPGQKWATDVTEFFVLGQKQYLSPTIDLFNREVIAYELAPSPVMGLVTAMLDKALTRLEPGSKLVMHSDQGWHYRHRSYQNTLQAHGITQSMSRKGNCLDNAVAENFFGHFKEEFLRQRTFTSLPEFKKELDLYIHWFNQERIQLKLKGLSPVEYRTQSLATLEMTPD